MKLYGKGGKRLFDHVVCTHPTAGVLYGTRTEETLAMSGEIAVSAPALYSSERSMKAAGWTITIVKDAP